LEKCKSANTENKLTDNRTSKIIKVHVNIESFVVEIELLTSPTEKNACVQDYQNPIISNYLQLVIVFL